jgi:hypothetical protein
MSVLRELARTTPDKKDAAVRITVLLLPPAAVIQDASETRAIGEFRGLGIDILQADVINDSVEELAEHFSRFDTIISCVGFIVARAPS